VSILYLQSHNSFYAQDPSEILKSLNNPAAKLQHVYPPYAAYYQEDMTNAKFKKNEEGINKVCILYALDSSYLL
jgi:hypothetical protein